MFHLCFLDLAKFHIHFCFLVWNHPYSMIHHSNYTIRTLLVNHSQINPCTDLHWRTFLFHFHVLNHFWIFPHKNLHLTFDASHGHLAILPTMLHDTVLIFLCSNHSNWTNRKFLRHVFCFGKIAQYRGFHWHKFQFQNQIFHSKRTILRRFSPPCR